MDSIHEESHKNYLVFFEKLDGLVTRDQMRSYLETIDLEMRELNELRDKYGKDKWKNFRTAFGGKEPSED